MSTKPHPVALTAVLLATRHSLCEAAFRDSRWFREACGPAGLASQLHRLAKGCRRAAEAECNGTFLSDEEFRRWEICVSSAEARRRDDAAITKYAARMDKRIAKLNAQLASFAIKAFRAGDPRGFTLRLVSTDDARPLPSNGMTDGEWGIE